MYTHVYTGRRTLASFLGRFWVLQPPAEEELCNALILNLETCTLYIYFQDRSTMGKCELTGFQKLYELQAYLCELLLTSVQSITKRVLG